MESQSDDRSKDARFRRSEPQASGPSGDGAPSSDWSQRARFRRSEPQASGPFTRLAGKVALITGAASGIGRESARLFAAEGARVVVADRDERAGATVAEEIGAAAGEAISLRCDVARGDDLRAAVATAERRFGALHVLFNTSSPRDLMCSV